MAVSTAQKAITNELIPPEGHELVGYGVMQLLNQIMGFKNDLGLRDKWLRAYELTRNKHWKNRNVKVPLVTANLIFTHRQRVTNMMTDNHPTFNVKQVGEVEEDKEDVFETLLRTAEFWWADQEQQAVFERSVIQSETYGGTPEKVLFNPDLENGIGEVETLVVDPFHFGWWPAKQPYDSQRSEAALHFYPESVRTLRRKYPKFAEHIKSDSEVIKELGDERLEAMGTGKKRPQGMVTTILGAVKNLVNVADDGSAGIDAETLLVECWVRDYTEGEDGYKYPGKIRRILTCSGGTVILEDGPNPSINPDLAPEQASLTYLWSRFPYSYTQSITDCSDPWGVTDLEHLEEINVEINKALSQLTMFKDRVSNIKVINPENSGVANSQFTNSVGILNPSNPMAADAIRYMDLPKLPPDLIPLLSTYIELFHRVAGSFEMEQMDKDGSGQLAYKAIAALLERAVTMLRGKIRNYSKMIRERGRMYLSCAMNWYTEPRWVSYEENGEKMGHAINGQDLMIPAKLNVVSGSTMPVSRIQEREEAIALYDKQAIDNEELLKKLDWPDWKRVVGRLKMGPIGEFIQKLGAMGFPPTLLQVLQEIGAMEWKDFEKALEKGEIPPLAALLPGPEEMAGGEGANPELEAELGKIQAEIDKIRAEIALTEEKAVTERVSQQVSLAGVEFDQQKLIIERARTVSDISAKARQEERDEAHTAVEMDRAAAEEIRTARGEDREDVRTAADIERQGGEQERADQSEKREDKRLSAEIQTKEAEQRAQGPYREKGLRSNNKQPKKK